MVDEAAFCHLDRGLLVSLTCIAPILQRQLARTFHRQHLLKKIIVKLEEDTDQLIQSVDAGNQWVNLPLSIVIHYLKSAVITILKSKGHGNDFKPENGLSFLLRLLWWVEMVNIDLQYVPLRVEGVANHLSPRQVMERSTLGNLKFFVKEKEARACLPEI